MIKPQDNVFANLITQLQRDLPLEPLTRLVNLAALARYADAQELEWTCWVRDMDRLHRAECKDPDCEARVCRMARATLNGRVDHQPTRGGHFDDTRAE